MKSDRFVASQMEGEYNKIQNQFPLISTTSGTCPKVSQFNFSVYDPSQIAAFVVELEVSGFLN